MDSAGRFLQTSDNILRLLSPIALDTPLINNFMMEHANG